MLVGGIMSGTSLDGVDVAFVEVVTDKGTEERPHWAVQTIATHFVPYPDTLREQLSELRRGLPTAIGDISRLHYELGGIYADAVEQCAANTALELTQCAAIGLHGQTVWHAPPSQNPRLPNTFQLGQPALLAERLGVPIISDFRARDIAAGGEGAPLVPFADYVLLSSAHETRVVLNIGGIANVTFLPANGGLQETLAFDTGPGNLLIDAVIQAQTGAKYDAAGALAAQGTPDKTILERLLTHPYFAQKPPKSTGAEIFGTDYAAEVLHLADALSVPDTLATVTALTVRSIADAITRLLPDVPTRIIVGGGGIHNQTVMQGLRQALPHLALDTHEQHGISSDFKEAIAFALLAAAHTLQIPANIPRCTGARRPRILGSLTPP